MKLFLARHTQPESGLRMDPTRKLTDTGKDQAVMMGKWLSRQIEKPDLVIQSNFKRSQSTAKRIAKQLDAPIITSGRLDPEVSPQVAWREIRKIAHRESQDKCVIVITHGPLIQRLFAYLIGCPTVEHIHFAHGAIAYFNSIPPIDDSLREADYTYDEREVKRLILGDGGASGNCDHCEEAADRGWVDMDEVFVGPMGDEDEPPLHPNCDCTVEYKTQRFRVYEGVREAIEDDRLSYFHWMVTPNCVARDEGEQSIITEAALAIAEAALAEMPDDVLA